MNALAEFYGNEDIVILGFPCNQFGKQEPGANATEIFNGIHHVRPGGGFETKIILFEKTEVNGKNENEIFTFLKSACEYTDTDFSSNIFYEPKRVGDIHWNFEKFLIGRDGKPRARFHPRVTNPEDLKSDLTALLYEEVPTLSQVPVVPRVPSAADKTVPSAQISLADAC
ncbi:hypothetical protein OTU49_000638 [Cherax quadricarinatus]|uniref:Glutathione peroxidase n=1 Tax=Cherax quadricarinatus TaxID=27406 RepID=A0AAW0XK53_CHEQU